MALHGLTIVSRRKVSFGRLDPARAREIFIEGALVAGELDTKQPFFAHNRALVREVEELEHGARRQDVLVDERALFAFKRAADLDRSWSGPCTNMGVVFGRLRRTTKAVEAYHNALAREPQNPIALFNLGTALHEHGQHR